jgi:hypothetical protein
MTNTTIDLETKHVEQEASKVRHIMVFTFGMVIPAIFSMWDLPFIGMWVAGVVFCIYAFARQDSDAAIFGMFISILTIILIFGSIEMTDQVNEGKAHEIFPSYVMQ